MKKTDEDRPQYHFLPANDPVRAVNILRAAAGLDLLADDVPDEEKSDDEV